MPKDNRDENTKQSGQSWTAQMLKKHGKSPHIKSTGKGGRTG